MSAMASHITSLTIVYSSVYSGADQRKHQSSAPLAYVWGIHWWPVNSPHKRPVTRKMFPFDDVIVNMTYFSVSTKHDCPAQLGVRTYAGMSMAKFEPCIYGSGTWSVLFHVYTINLSHQDNSFFYTYNLVNFKLLLLRGRCLHIWWPLGVTYTNNE